jgi:hypothetical protein
MVKSYTRSGKQVVHQYPLSNNKSIFISTKHVFIIIDAITKSAIESTNLYFV